MANTATTDLSSERILLNEGAAGTSTVMGTLAADTAPGQVVFYTVASNNWAKAVSSTAAHGLAQIGIVGYKKRINQTTNAIKVITDNWDVSEAEDKRAPIHTSGFCIAYITDQNAALGVLTNLQLSATAGSLTVQALTTGYFTQPTVATVASDVADDDTRAVVGIGNFMGKIWGDV